MYNKVFYLLVYLYLMVNSAFAGIPMNHPYLGPTQQLVKRESKGKIEKTFKEAGIPNKLFPFFDSIANNENWGHIGYHGSTQEFRIYQDIIRFTLEEVLDTPIRDNFHFFRVPGDSDLNFNSVKDYIAYWGEDLDNRTKVRAKQLLALNYSIYSNFEKIGSSSIVLFANGESKHKFDYVAELTPFFKELGISEKNLKTLFATARKFLDTDKGVLYRLEETSHLKNHNKKAYDFLDQQGYPCLRGGFIYDKKPVSQHFEKIMTQNYVKKKIDVSPQLRVLLNNKYTLNPNSFLNVYRWDCNDEETTKNYESAMRTSMRSMSYDKKKVEAYRKKLTTLWSQ